MATVHSIDPTSTPLERHPSEVWYVTRRRAGHVVGIVSPLYETREQAAGFRSQLLKRYPEANLGLTTARSDDAMPDWLSPVFMRDGRVIAAQEVRHG